MPRLCLYMSGLALGLACAAPSVAQDEVPVMVGGDETLDACNTLGAVTGLDPQGDNFLSVRAGPGTEYERTDQLGPGRKLWLCDQRGDWLAIVYNNADGSECGVSSPQAEWLPYDGPCNAGWVFKSYVTVIAG